MRAKHIEMARQNFDGAVARVSKDLKVTPSRQVDDPTFKKVTERMFRHLEILATVVNANRRRFQESDLARELGVYYRGCMDEWKKHEPSWMASNAQFRETVILMYAWLLATASVQFEPNQKAFDSLASRIVHAILSKYEPSAEQPR